MKRRTKLARDGGIDRVHANFSWDFDAACKYPLARGSLRSEHSPLRHTTTAEGVVMTNHEAAVAIEWPTSLATDASNEEALFRALVPFTKPAAMRKLTGDLDAPIKQQIESLASQRGFNASQANGLRRGMLKICMGPRTFMSLNGNSDAKTRLIATAFEQCVERHLRSHIPPSVLVTTEADRKRRAAAAGTTPGPTPDLTFSPPIRINGKPVAWVDMKMLYASYVLRKISFMPECKLGATAEKYSRAFGPGAFVFGNGFCRALQDDVDALFLDATPLDMSTIHAVSDMHQRNIVTTVEEMMATLGVNPSPPPPTRPPPPQVTALHSVTTRSTSSTHNWDARIQCMSRGTVTFHYHECTTCGAHGVRRKISNKKAEIVATATCTAPPPNALPPSSA